MPPSPDITFYYAPGACSLAPHILLHEVGATYTPKPFSIGAQGTNMTSDFAAVNPKLQVPTLCIASPTSWTSTIAPEIITESPAVCTMISNLKPELNLMGTEGLGRVRVLEWFNYLSGTLHGGGFGHLFRPENFSFDHSPESLKNIQEKARENITACFELIESKLRDGMWAVGGAFTGVDAFLLVFWRWGSAYGFEMEKCPKYHALMRKLLERDTVKRTLEVEDIKPTL